MILHTSGRLILLFFYTVSTLNVTIDSAKDHTEESKDDSFDTIFPFQQQWKPAVIASKWKPKYVEKTTDSPCSGMHQIDENGNCVCWPLYVGTDCTEHRCKNSGIPKSLKSPFQEKIAKEGIILKNDM